MSSEAKTNPNGIKVGDRVERQTISNREGEFVPEAGTVLQVSRRFSLIRVRWDGNPDVNDGKPWTYEDDADGARVKVL